MQIKSTLFEMKKARLNTWQVKFSVQLRMMQNFTSWGSPLEKLIKFKMININLRPVHVKIITTYSKLDIFFPAETKWG